jgi:putative transposase
MTSYQKLKLFETRRRIFRRVALRNLSVKEGSVLLGLSRQGFWYRRKQLEKYGTNAVISRKPGPKPYSRAWNRTDKATEDLVESIRNSFNIGPDRIRVLLDDQGIKLARMTIYRILIRKKLLPTKKTIRRNFKRYTLGYPGAEIQIDATFIEGRKSFVIFAAIDDHLRWGFAKLYGRCTVSNSIDFLANILQHAPFPIQAIRTDNGSENTIALTNYAKQRGIIHKKNPPRMPIHNGKVERFHKTIQEECLWRITTNHPKDYLDYQLDRFINFYNYHRPHFGLGMDGRTPYQQLRKYINDNKQNINVKRTMILYRG